MKGISSIAVFVIALVALTVFTWGIVPAVWLAAIFIGAPGRAVKAEKRISATLMTGETIIAQAMQFRAFAFFARRAVIAITTSRIIIVRRGLLGGFKMEDVQWKDLKDVTMEENVLPDICGSNLRFDVLNQPAGSLIVDGIPSSVAERIYAHAQAEEQAWEEKRRVRGMEEVRAAAGGVVVHAQPAAPAGAPAGVNRQIAQIQEAKALLDAGTISDAEFQEMKSKILSSPV